MQEMIWHLGRGIKVTRMFVGAALAVVVTMAPALALTGNDLYRYCVGDLSKSHAGECMFYIAGAAEGLHVGIQVGAKGGGDASFRLFCRPKTVTGIEYVDVVRKYLSGLPEQLNLSAIDYVAFALVSAWPCKQ